MSKHRSQEEIVADMLYVITKRPKKTHIMYGANLSYGLLCKYLKKLVNAGLVRYRNKEAIYELTNQGETYLETYLEYKENETAFIVKKAVLNEILGVSKKVEEGTE